MGLKFIVFVFGILLISLVYAISDTHVFQGQYFEGTEFQQGTFEFKFDIYTGEVFGDLVYSNTTNLTTGNWGEWRVELEGISAAANNVSKDYFMEITIDNSTQTPRRRLTHFNYLRKNVDEETSGDISSSGRIGAEEYTYVPSEGQSVIDSYFNFVGPSGGDLIRISPREDFLGFPNTTSIFVISDNESYVGMTYFISPINGLPNSWLWTDIHGGSGGFALLDTENLSVGKEFIVKGTFANDRLSLGGVSNNPQGESSAGMDFIIYKDANGTKSFFVDSANSYATTINALLNVTDIAYFDEAYVNGTKVCLEDGTNCQVQNISFSENDTLQTITDRGSTTTNNMTIGSVLNFIFGGFIQEFADRFFISKDLEVDGNVTADYYLGDGSYLAGIIGQPGANGSQGIQGIQGINGTEGVDGINGVNGSQGLQGIPGPVGANGTNGINGSQGIQGIQGEQGPDSVNGSQGSIGPQGEQGIPGVNGTTAAQYVSFISTVDGDLKTGPKYLALGTDSPISGGDDESSWIIDRDLTITGFLWNAKSNNMNKVAEIILIKSTSNKDSFSETSLSEDIQGATTGSATGSVSFSQGDLAAIKYSSAGSGNKKIKDLSITLIGTYD
jgi:hypothetical protein